MKHKTIKSSLLLCLIILGIQACKMGPNYSRPDLNVDVDWDSTAVKGDQVAQIKWWDLYQDSLLESYISEALKENYNLRVAAAKIQELQAFRKTTKSALFPQIGVNTFAEGEAGHNAATGVTKNNEKYRGIGTLSWELDLWGKIRRQVEAANAEYLGTYEAYRSMSISLVAEVAKTYFSLQDIDNRLRITRRTLIARQEAQRIAELRFKGGLVSEIEYQQATVELAQTKSLIPELERQVKINTNELAILLGRPPQELARSNSISDQPVVPAIPVGLSSELLERRPDIRQAEDQLVAANAQIGAAKADYFPNLTLTGKFGYQSPSLNNFVANGFNYWEYIGDITAPLFSAGRIKGNVEAKKAQYNQVLNQYKQTVNVALKEVSDGLVTFQKTAQTRDAQTELLTASQEYLRLAQLQYLNGIVNYLDVLDAQRRLFEAEISESAAIKEQLVSMVDLYKALGGGWDGESCSQGNVGQ